MTFTQVPGTTALGINWYTLACRIDGQVCVAAVLSSGTGNYFNGPTSIYRSVSPPGNLLCMCLRIITHAPIAPLTTSFAHLSSCYVPFRMIRGSRGRSEPRFRALPMEWPVPRMANIGQWMDACIVVWGGFIVARTHAAVFPFISIDRLICSSFLVCFTFCQQGPIR